MQAPRTNVHQAVAPRSQVLLDETSALQYGGHGVRISCDAGCQFIDPNGQLTQVRAPLVLSTQLLNRVVNDVLGSQHRLFVRGIFWSAPL